MRNVTRSTVLLLATLAVGCVCMALPAPLSPWLATDAQAGDPPEVPPPSCGECGRRDCKGECQKARGPAERDGTASDDAVKDDADAGRGAAPLEDQRFLGPIVLKALTIDEGAVRIRVSSGGCTTKASIRARVEAQGSAAGQVPHYAVTFERVAIDACKAFLPEGVELSYGITSDLGIQGRCTLTVTNALWPKPEAVDEGGTARARELVAATSRAIGLERAGYERRLHAAVEGAGSPEDVARLEARIAEMKRLEAEYASLIPSDYAGGATAPDPAAVLGELRRYGPLRPAVEAKAVVTWGRACKDGDLLDVAGMTKSGPFYHLAGIAGGDYAALEPGVAYALTLHLVYRREYVGTFPDYYVYVASWATP